MVACALRCFLATARPQALPPRAIELLTVMEDLEAVRVAHGVHVRFATKSPGRAGASLGGGRGLGRDSCLLMLPLLVLLPRPLLRPLLPLLMLLLDASCAGTGAGTRDWEFHIRVGAWEEERVGFPLADAYLLPFTCREEFLGLAATHAWLTRRFEGSREAMAGSYAAECRFDPTPMRRDAPPPLGHIFLFQCAGGGGGGGGGADAVPAAEAEALARALGAAGYIGDEPGAAMSVRLAAHFAPAFAPRVPEVWYRVGSIRLSEELPAVARARLLALEALGEAVPAGGASVRFVTVREGLSGAREWDRPWEFHMRARDAYAEAHPSGMPLADIWLLVFATRAEFAGVPDAHAWALAVRCSACVRLRVRFLTHAWRVGGRPSCRPSRAAATRCAIRTSYSRPITRAAQRDRSRGGA